MNKLFCKILSTLVCAALVPSVGLAEEKNLMYVNDSFNDYATYEEPTDLSVSSKAYWIYKYANEEKGLLLAGNGTQSKLEYTVGGSGNTCISFDMMCVGESSQGTLKLKGSNNSVFTILSFTKMNQIKAHNGKTVGGYNSSSMTNVSLVFKPEAACYDIYVAGKLKKENYVISSLPITDVASLSFEFLPEDGNALVLDNINIFGGDRPQKQYPVSQFNEDEQDEITLDSLSFEPNIGTRVLLNEDFEVSQTLSASAGGNTISKITEEDGNNAVLFERKGTSDFHLNAFNLATSSDYVVYEFDFKVLEPDSIFNVMLRDDNEVDNTTVTLSKGGVFHMGSATKNIATDKWYRASIVYNLYDRLIDYYFNGEKLAEDAINGSFAQGAVINQMRFHATIYSAFGTTASETDKLKFLIDNVRVYDGKEPRAELTAVERVIELGKKSVFKNDNAVKKQLNGYIGLHTRSGVLFANGNKVLLNNKPYTENGEIMVNAAEIAEKTGAANAFGNEYVPLSKLFAGKRIYTDTTAINSGMAIIGDTSFSAPKNAEDTQKLNDFLFYLKPDDEMVKEIYEKSESFGQHPRLQATAADFAKLREEIKTNTYKASWAQSVITTADRFMDNAPLKYELRDGVRLLGVSREALNKMYTFGMAYQLTGEKKYVNRAWLDLKAISEFADWHPGHALDLGEMCAAAAIGYDWMYDAFSDEQRKIIEKGIYNNGLYDANVLYETGKGAISTLAIGDSNWNNVITGGISMAAMAMLDVYPQVAYRTVSNVLKAAAIVMFRFAPDGVWYEGPGYWEYVMQYTAKMFTSFDKTFGTLFGLENVEGLSNAAEYEIFVQSPYGIYDYGDGIEGTKTYCPEMLWLSNFYNKAGITSIVLNQTKGSFPSGEDLALALLWYDTRIQPGETSLPFDKYFASEGLIIMRDCWNTEEQSFVGIHAGKTNTDHFHLDGASFIFDSMGVRWARDLGQDNYNKVGYWDEGENGKRWTIFRMRAEAHNALVINPSELPDQKVISDAPIVRYESKPKGGIVVADTTQLYADDVISSRRGFNFTDNRKSLVIRDEVKLKKQSDVYWFMMTGSDVSIEGNTAILNQNGRKMKLEYVSSANAEISVAKAAPLPQGPTHPDNGAEKAINRIAIKATGDGDMTITVKLTPFETEGSGINEYDKSIDLWSVADGEIPVPPTISEVSIKGDTVNVTKGTIDYFFVEGTLSEVPEISAQSDMYNVEVIKGASLSEVSKIVVTDKTNETNQSVYSVVFHAIAKPKEFEGMTSIPITTVTASSEPQEENRAMNVLDGNLATRWSADGIGQYLILDLNGVHKVDNLAMAVASGSERQTKFVVSVSTDGVLYEDVFTGLTSGTTNEHEFYPLLGKQARYVKITGNGNTSASSGMWNSITEVVVTTNK